MQLTDIDHLILFIDRLVERGIFEKVSKRFRHELIKKCFEDGLDTETMRRYHLWASQFYSKLKKKEQKNVYSSSDQFETDISYGFHLYKTKNHKDSFVQNQMLARYAVKQGDLDLAERCNLRSIDDAEAMALF